MNDLIMLERPIAVVESFAEAWNQMDFEHVLAILSDDVVYHNIPMEPLIGRLAVKGFIDSFERLESVKWSITHIAANENIVLTERIDEMVVKGKQVVIPVMGVFEIRDNCIAIWRDYFDLKGFVDQMP